MIRRCLTVTLMAVIAAAISAPAFAQGSATSSIQGVVLDTGGGVIPGATVIAVNEATSGKSTAVSSANGNFTIPALQVGRYTVTVELQGFKTAVLKGVAVTSGAPATVQVKLEVGGLTEQVVVEAATQVVQTQSSAVATTLNTKQIGSLPLATRNTLDFITFLPGVNTPGGNRDSTVNGLPQSSINITVDGVSVQDNYLKSSDGFFARMSPRLDAVEEVTVTTASSGAEASAQGAVQIRFTTRSGSNVFSGSGYYYYQSEKLNTNTYFNEVRNLPKNVALQHQPGIRAGGPIVIPGVFDGRGKAFFFANYEENRTPRTITTTGDFLTPEARAGIFRYGTGGTSTQNLWALAAATGNTATIDPLISNLLNDIENSTKSGGTIEALTGNYVAQRFSFQQPSNGLTRYPTVRIDYNLSNAHRLNGSYNLNKLTSTPDTTNGRQPFFPGFPVTGAQISDRYTFQTSLRSTLGANFVNEARYGMSGGPTKFSPQLAAEMWNGSLANQGGYVLGINAAGISNPGSSAAYSAREGSTKFVDNTLTWLRGSHSLQMGGTYTQADVWLLSDTIVPAVSFGVVTGDPAANMFTATNFPGSSTAERTAAQNLYSVLSGRVSQIAGTSRVDPATGQYVYNGEGMQEGRLTEWDFFIQDNWRVKPNLSINVGLRYAYQLPFVALNSSYSTATMDDVWGISGNVPGCNQSDPTSATCNLFKPGTTPGIIPTYQNLGTGVKPYNADTDNLAPSIGVNWTPSAESGFLRMLLGQQGDTSFSGGWSRSYERRDMSSFTGVLGGNPGLQVTANRNSANGNLGTLPLLFRNGNLGPPPTCTGTPTAACVPAGPEYPIATTVTGSINTFDPNLQVPYADTWTAGFSRSVGQKSAFDVRYVGTRFRDGWTVYNMNETNIIENGFLDEFKKAQANLYANIAAGRGTTFAYFGAGTGTSPLPIYLAHFNGVGAGQAGDASKYTGANWSNQNFYNALSLYSPAVFTAAGTSTTSGLNGTASFRTNAVAAGLPRNFWVANPDALGGANVTGYGGYSNYNALQLAFRRRLSGGLQWDANFSVGRAYESVRYSFRVPRKEARDTGTVGDVSQSFKATAVYELPFGAGRRYMTGAGRAMDTLVGGWQVSGTTRIQSGRLLDLGNVRVYGMTEAEVQNAFKVRKVSNAEIYMWPQDIIDNTIKAYSRDLNGYTQGAPTGRYFAPANGPDCIETISNAYGDCGVRTLIVTGPMYWNVDLSVVKDIRIVNRQSFQFRFDMLNLMDTVVFTPVSGIGNTTQSNYQVTAATSGRIIQLVARYNW